MILRVCLSSKQKEAVFLWWGSKNDGKYNEHIGGVWGCWNLRSLQLYRRYTSHTIHISWIVPLFMSVMYSCTPSFSHFASLFCKCSFHTFQDPPNYGGKQTSPRILSREWRFRSHDSEKGGCFRLSEKYRIRRISFIFGTQEFRGW